jgi:putative hydrolase of the HAD superfamily
VEGLYKKPTVVNNVETLAAIPGILKHGAKSFSSIGNVKSAGTKLICLDSLFKNPGVYEIDMGTPMKKIIYDIGGGFIKPVKALQVGGPLGGVIPVKEVEKLNLDLKKAKELQTKYFHEYNTSLNGLLLHHKIDPLEFLKYVHNIDLDFLEKDIVLREELLKLDAKKIIFTNGSNNHVINITKHLGIDDLFNGIFDIVDCNFIPKPALESYEKLAKKFNINPKETVFIEDIAKNLKPAKKLFLWD